MSVGFETISGAEIENMLYLIMAHAGKTEARRFSKLNFERQQKITFILKKRAKRARNAEQPIDYFIVREVIDEAKKNKYILD